MVSQLISIRYVVTYLFRLILHLINKMTENYDIINKHFCPEEYKHFCPEEYKHLCPKEYKHCCPENTNSYVRRNTDISVQRNTYRQTSNIREYYE